MRNIHITLPVIHLPGASFRLAENTTCAPVCTGPRGALERLPRSEAFEAGPDLGPRSSNGIVVKSRDIRRALGCCHLRPLYIGSRIKALFHLPLHMCQGSNMSLRFVSSSF